MSVSEDVTDGIVCMICHQLLIADNDELCGCGHPVLCEDCWKELPKKDRNFGLQFFSERTGEVQSGGDQHE